MHTCKNALCYAPHTFQPGSPSLYASASRHTSVEILEGLIKPTINSSQVVLDLNIVSNA